MERPQRSHHNHHDNENSDKFKKKTFFRKRSCRFCSDKDFKADYKNGKLLSTFLGERAKIIPRRISGACALHQRHLTSEIKKARIMALLPFSTTQQRY